MKKLSLSSITALLGLCFIPACILSVTDDVATGDEVATDGATDEATTTATEGATDEATTTAEEVGTDSTDGATTDTTDVSETTDTTTDTTTGAVNMCGWSVEGSYYDCGFEGADPGGTNPIECPEGLVDGDPCETTGLTGEGCCDANGDNWYCTQEGTVFFMTCG